MDNSPFKDLRVSDIKPGSKAAAFYNLSGHPELLVRKSFLHPLRGAKDFDTAATYWSVSAEQFRAAVLSLGVRLPKTSYLIGNDPRTGEPALLVVSERISGRNLGEMFQMSAELWSEIERFYVALFEHIFRSYRNHEPVLVDFKNEQIVYGMAPGDIEPSLYYVDVDPFVKVRDSSAEEEQKFYSQLRQVREEMYRIELKTMPCTYLRKSRRAFGRLIKEAKPKSEHAKELWFGLKQESFG